MAESVRIPRERKTRKRQLPLVFHTHGGARPGAGRPRLPGSGVPHRRREALTRHQPVHVTLRIRSGLPTLRQGSAFEAVVRALRGGCEHGGFRVVHYSVQSNHLHLITESTDATVLSRGVRALCIRLARQLNAVFGACGRLFADRYHARVLRSPREVRNALKYVLNNARRHGTSDRGRHLRSWVDPYSSGLWFDGWQGRRGPLAVRTSSGAQWVEGRPGGDLKTRGLGSNARNRAHSRPGPLGRHDPRFSPDASPETRPAGSHLLRRGWRRGGLIPTDTVPGPDPFAERPSRNPPGADP